MRKKSKLLCLPILAIGLSLGNLSVNASTIIPNETPKLIDENFGVSGNQNSIIQNETKEYDANKGLVNSGIGNSLNNNTNKSEGATNSSSGSYEGEDLPFMTPDEILGNQDVTIEGFANTITSRLLDVVSLFQKFAKPFTIIMFILSALLSLISLVFGTNKVKTGLLGMLLSVLAYVGILYAPNLVLFFTQWLSA